MSELVLHAAVMLFGVLVAAIAQVLLKLEADKVHGSRIKEYLNARVIIAYGMMLFCTLCSIYAYRVIPISLGMILETMSYVFISLFGYFVFNEKLTLQKILGILFIILGIIVYSVTG